MSAYICPGCQANDMAEECWHDEKTWALAEALSVGLPGGPATWGTPVDRAWAFIDDADALRPDVGEPPYVATMFHPNGRPNVTTIGLVNGRYLFSVDEEPEFLGDVQDDEGRARLVMLGSTDPVHWVGDAPTSLHGNGAASFERTTRDPAEVTCGLCLNLLARESTVSEEDHG